eukprot:XP_014046952.1 PREDICTED: dedicator of cytokinesis protein 3-like [Salmo salar]
MSKSQSLETARGQRCPQCTAEITGEYVSTLLSLLRQMTEIHFHHLLNNFHSKEELKEFLLKIFCVFRNLMKLTIFPRDWSVMRLLTSHVIVATTQYLSPALHKNFSEADFDFKVCLCRETRSVMLNKSSKQVNESLQYPGEVNPEPAVLSLSFSVYEGLSFFSVHGLTTVCCYSLICLQSNVADFVQPGFMPRGKLRKCKT